MANKILILTRCAVDAHRLTVALACPEDGSFDCECLGELAAGLKRIREGGVDAILVDLSLPDCDGIATFDRLYAATPHTPILILSGAEGDQLALTAVQHGAHGYLSKGHFGSYIVVQTVRTILQRKAVEVALYRESVRAEITLNSIGDAVIGTDLHGCVDYLNVAAENLTGWSRKQAHGHSVHDVFNVIDAATRRPARDTVALALEQGRTTGLPKDTVLLRKDGSEAPIEDSVAPIHNWDGQITGAVIVFHDVSAAQAMTRKMAHLAQHDFLTNLPNRVLLNDRLEQAIPLAKRSGSQLAVLFLDLDNFKHINDSLGHAIGDLLLQSIALRLGQCTRDSDTVSRQGGDEFVVLLADGPAEEDAAVTANKILTALALPHVIEQHELFVTTSIGISIYPIDGEDAARLIMHADIAMYSAKRAGRNTYRFFLSEMNARAQERQSVEANLRRALLKDEFVMHYQAKVNLASGQITGVEALLRWQHPEWGMVLPERFVTIAEECGLIVPIGRWALREACMQSMQWRQAGLPPVSIAVNISAPEFNQKNFFDGVRDILRETGLDARSLELEITESVLMRDAAASAAILQKLKEMGVRLAVDDFGTGYSSLSYLIQFPIDVLKIDQSFVRDIIKMGDNSIIVGAVIGMGNNLKLRVIAEGVETQEQLNFLQAQHCEEGQGYLFSRPLPPSHFAALLEQNASVWRAD